jgi:polyisoprenyl-phosphate glycosyltransferase
LKRPRYMPDSRRPSFSVVVPLYNEAENVAPLVARISAAIEPVRAEYDHEIVLVNDGSSDGTLRAIREEMRRQPIVLVNLSRNFGHQLAATRAYRGLPAQVA